MAKVTRLEHVTVGQLRKQVHELKRARKLPKGHWDRKDEAIKLRSLRKSGLHYNQDRSGDYNPKRGRYAARLIRKASKLKYYKGG